MGVLEDEFVEAVQHIGTKTGLRISEEDQRRLFALHTRATRGPPPSSAPSGMHDEHFRAWTETEKLSKKQALEEYIEIVHRVDPDYFLKDNEEESKPSSQLPPEVRKQLEAAGIREFASVDASCLEDVFSSARSGSDLAPFLPSERDAKDEDGITPLIHAVDAEQSGAVAQLIKAKANLDIADPQGATALHYAALLGAMPIAKQLINAGADPTLLDEDDATPADTARSNDHSALAEFLKGP